MASSDEIARQQLAASTAIFGPGVFMAAETIKAAFDSPTFNDINSTTDFTFKLAPAFGTLTAESIKSMDAELVTAMDLTIKQLQKAIKEAQAAGKSMSWDDVLAVLNQNVALQPSPEKPVAIYNTYTYGPPDYINVWNDGSADRNTVENIMAFYRNTINDEDAIKASSITVDMVQQLANLVASTGARVVEWETFFGHTGDNNVQRILLDIGVLRFPDLDTPYFKVYRLRLHAWRQRKLVLMIESKITGLNIEFNSQKYVPRSSVLASITPEMHKKALQELTELFGGST